MSTSEIALPTTLARPTTVRWRVLSVLMLLSLSSYLLRGNLSIAAPTMIADLQLTEIQWGWVMAAFPLTYALFQFPGGVWGGRVGPRKALTVIAVAWAVLIALTSLVPGRDFASVAVIVGSLFLVQGLVGAAHAPVFPVVGASIERWFPIGGYAFPNGLISTGTTVGLAGLASLLPWLMGQVGWRNAFLLLTPISLAFALLWWWYARDRPADHPSVNAAEAALIGTIEHEADERGAAQPAWLRVLKDRNVLLVTLSYACSNFVVYVVFSWGFYYLVKVRGFSEQEAGFLTSLQWLGASVGAALGGWLCDKLCRRLGLRWGCRWPILICMLATALLMLGVAFHPNAYAAAAMLGLSFFFVVFAEGPFWAVSTAVGGRHAGAAGGLMNTGGNAIGFVNALLLSAVADAFGWAIAIAISTIFALLGAGFILMVKADQQMDQAD